MRISAEERGDWSDIIAGAFFFGIMTFTIIAVVLQEMIWDSIWHWLLLLMLLFTLWLFSSIFKRGIRVRKLEVTEHELKYSLGGKMLIDEKMMNIAGISLDLYSVDAPDVMLDEPKITVHTMDGKVKLDLKRKTTDSVFGQIRENAHLYPNVSISDNTKKKPWER